MAHRSQSFLLALLVSSCVTGLSGCGDGVKTASINGSVTLEGRPIGPGFVIFEPETGPDDAAMRSKMIRFGEDGKFSGEVPIGTHRIIIREERDEEPPPGSPALRVPPKIPLHYADPNVSKLRQEIKSDGQKEINFDLSARPK